MRLRTYRVEYYRRGDLHPLVAYISARSRRAARAIVQAMAPDEIVSTSARRD